SGVRVLQDSLDKRSINIAVDCEGHAPKEIRTQESQFHQMIVNLVKNAMEAIDDLAASGRRQESPRIQIRAYVEGEFLNLDVSDNGIGIVVKNQKMLFTAGYTTKKSGSGFGLNSVANFVRGSGGQIHPISDGIGKGTTMRIRLRLSAVAPWKKVDRSETS
ncbi:MAG: HAMP domain-containing sensor histidine kinase, partial [Dehalococcoidia bacterium]|nr:HAMP domain-containing sensor histidine kinase [Dehalococcoidia bacterium]